MRSPPRPSRLRRKRLLPWVHSSHVARRPPPATPRSHLSCCVSSIVCSCQLPLPVALWPAVTGTWPGRATRCPRVSRCKDSHLVTRRPEPCVLRGAGRPRLVYSLSYYPVRSLQPCLPVTCYATTSGRGRPLGCRTLGEHAATARRSAVASRSLLGRTPGSAPLVAVSLCSVGLGSR